ncbi:FecR family protein [Rhodonellum sp.]|uniref:FecR family protein n=1 Tax=Rhodonellum sp. TaxID=2231180 RepID=UPI002725CF18|nr:FecR family protein [Rhodonellum sp.]MDO9553287.1 DUF4974 domain-containing protein [Rhodonellum sp.]
MKRQNLHGPGIKDLLYRLLRGKHLQKEQKDQLDLWYNGLYEKPETPQDLEKIKNEAFKAIQKETGKRDPSIFYISRFAAAMIALVLVASLVFYISLNRNDNGLFRNKTTAWQTYQTQKGERKSILLPDSSHVFLAGNSKISIPDNFMKGRKVKLVGLAFFKVKFFDNLPFEVQTAKLQTAVLGTSFNVYAPENGEERVEVKTGKVKVKQNNGGKQTTLTKGQRVSTREENLITALISEREDTFSWINNTLIFNNVTVSEMAEKIEDWYGVEVRTLEEFNTCRITGKYQNQSLDEVLHIINYSINLKHKWENETLIIEKVTCK